MELIESTYVAFGDRIRAIERNMCDCDACRKSPALDLKFVVHHGQYRTHRVAGHDEVVGTDVALAHRLLKNGVAEATAWRGYALFSREAIERLGIQPEGLHRNTETYDLGLVHTASVDLDGRYRRLVDARRVFVSPKESDLTLIRNVGAPPAVVWEWLNDREKRRRWEDVVVEPHVLPGGRSGVGELSYCLRGVDAEIMTVLDWRPFDYFTVQSIRPPATDAILTSYRLTPIDDLTELQVTVELPDKGAKRGWARQSTERLLGRSLDRLAAAIADEPPLEAAERLQVLTAD